MLKEKSTIEKNIKKYHEDSRIPQKKLSKFANITFHIVTKLNYSKVANALGIYDLIK